MRPAPDVDVSILMAVALASKRRPANLIEIVAAADLVQGFVPYADKLGAAIQWLSAMGLVSAESKGYTLTPAAQLIMKGQPKKAEMEARLVAIRGKLDAYVPPQEYPSILLSDEELTAIIKAYKASRKAPGKNLLMPKPKMDRHFKIDGVWRRASATRGRKP